MQRLQWEIYKSFGWSNFKVDWLWFLCKNDWYQFYCTESIFMIITFNMFKLTITFSQKRVSRVPLWKGYFHLCTEGHLKLCLQSLYLSNKKKKIRQRVRGCKVRTIKLWNRKLYTEITRKLWNRKLYTGITRKLWNRKLYTEITRKLWNRKLSLNIRFKQYNKHERQTLCH